MGVHGRTFVGKTSTRSTLNSAKSKKPIEEIDSQLKNISPKSSTSSTVAGTRPNASASVDANMAPALTEPLSPTEKLSTTAASVTPETISSKKEAEELQVESSATPSSSSRASPAGNSTNQREKRSSSRNVPISTRVTRSKDSPIAQERANTPSSVRNSPIASGTRKLKLDTTNDSVNEPMGLSAATPSTTSTATPTSSLNTNNNNNNNTIACKDNSTEQLLADLTNDFEETITAEICLRKQLPEVKVSTPDASLLNTSEAELDIPVIKGACPDTTVPGDSKTLIHMESVSDSVSGDDYKTEETKCASGDVEKENVVGKPSVASSDGCKEPEEAVAPSSITETPAVQSNNVDSASGVRILAVEDLPPINSDSTMTASEEETEELDALEARLSQLDGTAVTPITNDDANNVTITPSTFVTAASSNAMATTATPPRTPSQLQLTPTPVTTAPNSVQQLLLTPTSSSSHTLALTPQSTSSLMREVGATVTGGEIEDQEFEEVLKALKGFDANSASADTVLDLNVLFNEVYTSLNCEDIGNNQHQNMLASIAVPAVAKVALSPLKELHGEIEKKQQNMQRKIDFIMRRLRKMQVRYMSKHTSEEIAGLFELAARITNKGTSHAHSSGDGQAKSVISARPPAHSWEEDIKHPVPSSQVANLLHRLETSANAQQLCTTTSNNTNLPSYSAPTLSSTQQLKKSKKFGETSSSPLSTTDVDAQKSDEVVPTFSPKVVDELTHVAGMLRAEMRDVQTAYDSDATESSSGGESADEMVSYNNQVQQSLSIVKRAAWRYSRERAAIASRWSWLLSQIADLEIKIRQHSELYQEVVRTKGAVVCEEELSKTGTLAPRETINAYGETEETALSGASRTRGFVPSQFRKRKLLQTTSLHTISKKAARPSTIKCGCQWPLNPCALCTGRTDPTAPRDLPDTMMLSERVALLDPGYHPVLSFPEDVNNSIHIEAIARTTSWQQRIVRIQPKSVARSIWKAEREAANSNSHNASRKFGDVLMPTQKRRYIRRKERNATSTSSSIGVTGGVTTSSGGNNLDVSMSAGMGYPKTMSTVSQSTSAAPTSIIKHEPPTVGNGTANLFTSTTTSTTPLGANKAATSKQMAQNLRKMHCHLVGDGVLLEPLSPNSSSSQMNDCQTPQNFEPYNPNQAHSSLISNQQQHQYSNHNNSSNKKGKQRRSLASSFHQQQNNGNNNSNHSFQYNHNNSNNSTHFQQNYSNGDIQSDYWDSTGGRSRTASPTHGIGGSSNYHKYERSLERRNRISYDIDNIVIPYSVAAATRVEILPYKEIPTPKWRVFDETDAISEETTDPNTGEPTDTIPPKIENEQLSEDVKMKDISLLKSDAKVEHNSNCQSISKEMAEAGENIKETNTTKSKEAEELINEIPLEGTNNHEAILKKEINSNTAACIPVEAEVQASKLGECVSGTSTQTADEPPIKRIKVSTDSAESIKVASLLANDIEQRTMESKATVKLADETDCQDKEQILLTDLEEDISDESFVLRHERALNEERRKFQTYLKFPWSTRSRANRRIDSRAESSGANTPDPASPAPNTPSLGGGDQESIPSPLAPSTPLTPLETINEAPESGPANNVSSAHSSSTIAPPAFPITAASISSKRNERRRTTSTKNQNSERIERRSLTPDSREVPFIVPPYEPLKFPLSDEMFEMLSSVTYLPPSVSSFYADDYNSKDDHHNSIGVGASGSSYFKSAVGTTRSSRRSSVRNEFILQRSLSKTSAAFGSNCDVNGKRRRINKRHSLINLGHQVAESSDATKYLPYINGQSKNLVVGAVPASTATTNSTDIDEDTEDIDDVDYFHDMMDDDDDDDGYSKHPLAPGNDIDSFIDDGYNAFMGEDNANSLLGVSDSESEVDPFEDDDPNDPEWKGESRSERPERFRKRS